MPAPFECACHQAVVRLPTVLLALRPLGLVARVLSRQRQCLAGEVVFRAHPLECLHGGGAPSRLDGVQDGGGDGPIDAAAANRQTGGGATIDAPPMAYIPWHPARGAAIGHIELPSAASTASQATEHRRPPFGGAPGTTLRPVAQWRIVLRDNHAGYMSWEDFLHTQQLLEANRHRSQGGAGGAAKRGPALLSGL